MVRMAGSRHILALRELVRTWKVWPSNMDGTAHARLRGKTVLSSPPTRQSPTIMSASSMFKALLIS